VCWSLRLSFLLSEKLYEERELVSAVRGDCGPGPNRKAGEEREKKEFRARTRRDDRSEPAISRPIVSVFHFLFKRINWQATHRKNEQLVRLQRLLDFSMSLSILFYHLIQKDWCTLHKKWTIWLGSKRFLTLVWPYRFYFIIWFKRIGAPCIKKMNNWLGSKGFLTLVWACLTCISMSKRRGQYIYHACISVSPNYYTIQLGV
jgi:hypothetical protein